MSKPKKLEKCPDCNVAVGQPHKDGCDVERCMVCQRLGCAYKKHNKKKAAWTGYWPGELECKKKGWMLGNHPDLNRWAIFQHTGKDPGPHGTNRAQVRSGWLHAGRAGTKLTEIVVNGQAWTGVLWDGDEDPDWFKSAGLEEEKS